MDYEIIGTIQEQNLTKCLNDMLQKNVTSSAKIDVILTPNSNPDLVANNLKDLLPSKRYLDAFPKNKVSFYYEGFGPYFSLSK